MGQQVSVRLQIAGMTCDGCARHVSDALAQVGAQVIAVDWRRGEARLEADPALVPGVLEEAVRRLGYRVQAVEVVGDPLEGGAGCCCG